jgi:hypothetical protein
VTIFTNFSQPNLHGTDARLLEDEISTGVQTRQQAAAKTASQAAGNSLTPAMPTTGARLSTASTTASSLATPLAAIERGLGRLTPGQVKVADLRRALAAGTAGQVGSPGIHQQRRHTLLEAGFHRQTGQGSQLRPQRRCLGHQGFHPRTRRSALPQWYLL